MALRAILLFRQHEDSNTIALSHPAGRPPKAVPASALSGYMPVSALEPAKAAEVHCPGSATY